jgi:hypothetical protein
MERWRLRLQPYSFKIIHQPGSTNPADFMSRHPLTAIKSGDRTQKVADDYVNFVIANTIPKSMTIDEIKAATKTDSMLQKIIQIVQQGNWHTDN